MRFHLSDMKKRFIGFTVFLIVISTLLSACTGNNPPADTADESSSEEQTSEIKQSVVCFAGGENAYSIVRGETAEEEESYAAVRLRDAIKTETKATLKLNSDIVIEAMGLVPSQYEILVGKCDRDETREVMKDLKTRDYVIRIIGDKIVIAGGCANATSLAVDYFIAHFLTAEGTVSGDVLYSFTGTYPLRKLTLNGRDLSEYTLVYQKKSSADYKEAVDLFVSRVSQMYGIKLKTAHSGEEKSGGPEILFGDCGRGPAQGLSIEGRGYAMNVSGADVAFCAEKDYSKAAIQCFLEKYIPVSKRGEVDIVLPEGKSVFTDISSELREEGTDLRLMTFNVLGGDTLKTRAVGTAELIGDLYPDFAGLQECNSNGHTVIFTALAKEYGAVCTKVGNTETACHTPIMYLKNKYTVIESGAKLFDSRWTETSTMTFAWAVFEDGAQRKYAVINAHWAVILTSYDTETVFGKKMSDSEEGLQWREDNSREVLAKADELRAKYPGISLFFMGDMNAKPSAESVKMLNTGVYKNGYSLTDKRTEGYNSFHDEPGCALKTGDPIDNIFVTEDTVSVLKHKIINTKAALECSDHSPVILDVKLK